jgi:hypothetical protein
VWMCTVTSVRSWLCRTAGLALLVRWEARRRSLGVFAQSLAMDDLECRVDRRGSRSEPRDLT